MEQLNIELLPVSAVTSFVDADAKVATTNGSRRQPAVALRQTLLRVTAGHRSRDKSGRHRNSTRHIDAEEDRVTLLADSEKQTTSIDKHDVALTSQCTASTMTSSIW